MSWFSGFFWLSQLHRLKLQKAIESRKRRQRLQAWALLAVRRSWQKRRVTALQCKQQQRRLWLRFVEWRQHGRRMRVRL
jgi:hypothetical protein